MYPKEQMTLLNSAVQGFEKAKKIAYSKNLRAEIDKDLQEARRLLTSIGR